MAGQLFPGPHALNVKGRNIGACACVLSSLPHTPTDTQRDILTEEWQQCAEMYQGINGS